MPLLPFQHRLSRTFPSAGSPGCVKLSLTCLLPDLCNSLLVSAGRPRQVGLGSTEQWVHRASYVWTKYRPFLFAFLYWVLYQHWTVLLAVKSWIAGPAGFWFAGTRSQGWADTMCICLLQLPRNKMMPWEIANTLWWPCNECLHGWLLDRFELPGKPPLKLSTYKVKARAQD